MKKFLYICFLISIILISSFVFSQNFKTVLKTDNKIFRFTYRYLEDYKQRFEFGKSIYSNLWDKPIINFMPDPDPQLPLLATNSNAFSILLDGSTTKIISNNLIYERVNNYSVDNRQIIKISPAIEKISFVDGESRNLSRIYVDIGQLIAIYGCQEFSRDPNYPNGCLGKQTVYRDGYAPMGATRTRTFSQGISWYRNPQYCFSDTDPDLGTPIHICTGDCGDDDEGLTICFRKK
jgi:hypothetical protein